MIQIDNNMPISQDEFRAIDTDGPTGLDLSPDTTQGTVFRFLLSNADRAFRQREIIEAVDVPKGSVGPTLKRLEERGLVEHRDRFWAVSDVEHAIAAAGIHSATAADELDGGFSDDEVEAWMETAAEPIGSASEDATEPEG